MALRSLDPKDKRSSFKELQKELQKKDRNKKSRQDYYRYGRGTNKRTNVTRIRADSRVMPSGVSPVNNYLIRSVNQYLRGTDDERNDHLDDQFLGEYEDEDLDVEEQDEEDGDEDDGLVTSENAYDLQLALALSLSAVPSSAETTKVAPSSSPERGSLPRYQTQESRDPTLDLDDMTDIAASDCASIIDHIEEEEEEEEEWTNVESVASPPERPTYAQMTKIEIT